MKEMRVGTSRLRRSATVLLVVAAAGYACGGKIDEGADLGDDGGSTGTGSGGGGGGALGGGGGGAHDGGDAGGADSTSHVGAADACISLDAAPFDAGADCYDGPGSGPGAHCGCTAVISGANYNINCDGSDRPVCTCSQDGKVVRSFTMTESICLPTCGFELPTLADQFVASTGCGFPRP
jgi:hypothetical protein